jgi:ribosomal protein S18 acetylase RimI-like enzyme
VDVVQAGAVNLAGFIGSTAGRIGTVEPIHGGVAIAGPVAVPNAYVNAAIPTGASVSAAQFFDDAMDFFAGLERAFVLWTPMSDPTFATEAAARNLVLHSAPSPAMVVRARTDTVTGLEFRIVDSDESAAIFGDLCERGYEAPGMAWLMAHQQGFNADDLYWHIAFDGNVPVSAACGCISGETGGIYSVATPPEFRGRGFAAMVTSVATNHLVDLGASRVVLQASLLGFGVYERLGFTVYDHFNRFAIPAPAT